MVPFAFVQPLLVALAVALPAGAAAQPRERVDSTLPSLETPVRGARTLATRPMREAGEARFAEELARQAELERLFDPYRAQWGGAVLYPSVVPPAWVGPTPCPPPGCGALRPRPR